jgi:nicotinate-nucleotide pyrophosphorylase (carboxylating)
MTVDQLIRAALEEDIAQGKDITSDLFVENKITGKGWIEARQSSVISGLTIVSRVFQTVDQTLFITPLANDGKKAEPMQKVLLVEGKAGSILRGERTALNFLGHLSGVATLTRAFVDAANSFPAKILCTRKTTPGWRDLEVAAVRHGGGDAYRTNLYDALLLKDNHEGILGGMNGVEYALRELGRSDPQQLSRILELGKIEVSSLEELSRAEQMGWKQVLLDNFTPAMTLQAVQQFGHRMFLEASGGITIRNVSDYAATGVHAISIGALTHSAPAADFSLEVEWRRP